MVYLSVFCQTELIEEKIKDKETGETLVGSNVIIHVTTAGTITKLSGEFRLTSVPIGNFPGGIMQISTEGITDKSGIEFNYSIKLEPGTSFNDFLTMKKNPLNRTVFNCGFFDIPDNFPDDLRTITSKSERLHEAGRSFNSNWILVDKQAYPDRSFSVTWSQSLKLPGIQTGYITILNYRNSVLCEWFTYLNMQLNSSFFS